MFNEVLKKISDKQKILILTHINPDGDALGSSSGLKFLLEEAGKEAVVLLENKLPKSLEIFGDNFSYKETKTPSAKASPDKYFSVPKYPGKLILCKSSRML